MNAVMIPSVWFSFYMLYLSFDNIFDSLKCLRIESESLRLTLTDSQQAVLTAVRDSECLRLTPAAELSTD